MSGFLSSLKKAGGDGLKSSSASEYVDMGFTIQPAPGESGFSQWVAAMKMVAQLPGGIPSEFRRKLWVTMAEKHLASRGIDWTQVEKTCFSEWSLSTDSELGNQIVKDLHRTGCSLFCGEGGQKNQTLLKRVLLAYARWNKAVGYCQGFNMLAALILQVTDKSESDALKLMIYLIEGVLPDSYFADSLRGLSIDMAVFRELLHSKLPRLSQHLNLIQNAVKDGSSSYEPPLTNVFTMQWFLTLFCNCLPQPTVLRIWDLIFLEGNEILLRTALAIWQVLAPRILVARTADEFYCIMGVLTRELLENNLIDANFLIEAIVSIGPLHELKKLRDYYLYNVTPWGTAVSHTANKQIEVQSRHTIPLDISALKKQYVKLRQRQRQAHIIFSAAISRQPLPATPVAMNHLLVGKSALVPSKRLGPPKGSIPPARQVPSSTLQWKDSQKRSSSSSSSDTELCDDDVHSSSESEEDGNKSQCKDNANSGDSNFILIDNTVNVKESNVSPEIRLDLDTTSPHILTFIKPASSPDKISFDLKPTSDSEDESSDFEIFLADRLKKRTTSDEFALINSNLTRRNSERALQIIEENSLILRKIIQCQSRLSPSLPPVLNNTSESTDSQVENTNNSQINISYLFDENPELTNKDKNLQKIQQTPTINFQEDFTSKNNEDSSVETNILIDNQSPKYESRYHNILEKSKSLEERYNSLILKPSKDNQTVLLSRLHESKSETPVGLKNNIFKSTSSDYLINSNCNSETPNTKSQEIVVPPILEDDYKDSKSNKLIQENLDLLKLCSSNKGKKTVDKPKELLDPSQQLIQENVNLLELISSDKNDQGSFINFPEPSTDSPKNGCYLINTICSNRDEIDSKSLELNQKELVSDLLEINLKRSNLLSPVDIKSKIDEKYSCDKKTEIHKINSSPDVG